MIEIKWNVKQCGVYCIRNKVNGKQYFGSSVNCYHRIKSQHLAKLRNGTHTNPHLQSSFRKHREKAFEYFIVELCKEKYMLIQEQWHIDNSKCLDRRFGYNINTKAEKPILTDEQCEKIRLSKLGKKRSKKRRSVGVYKSGKNWMVKIGFRGREFFLGSFCTHKCAQQVYLGALCEVRKGKKPTRNQEGISHCKSVAQKTTEGEVVRNFGSLKEAGEAGVCSQDSIQRCCSGKSKQSCGYIWEYE